MPYPTQNWLPPQSPVNAVTGARSPAMSERLPEHCAADPKNNRLLGDLPLAMSYVPSQSWHKLHEPEQALRSGTLFQELDLPFLGYRGEEGNCYGK